MKKGLIFFNFIFVAFFSISLQSYAYITDYPEVYNLRWNNRTAKWSVEGHEDKYKVRLYRDDRRVVTRTVSSKSKSFAREMSRGDHEYYFEVRPFIKILVGAIGSSLIVYMLDLFQVVLISIL